MRIAIVGTGLAGLAIGWHMLGEGCQIVFFDHRSLGKGASGVAAGLVHPYVGQKARRNNKATEGLSHLEELLTVSENARGSSSIIQRGLIRVAINEEQRINLKEASDVEEIAADEFLIHSGTTIDVPLYLQGLFLACQKRGAIFYSEKVSLDAPLTDFDHTVFAVGNEWITSSFAKNMPLKRMKGQVLLLRLSEPLERSRIVKGYLAKTSDPHVAYLGATYERRFDDGEPSLEVAHHQLIPRLNQLLPASCRWEILGCRAGIRLCLEGEAFGKELVNRVDDKCWWLGGLGSKGLLYHAYLAKKLAYDILCL